MVMKFLNLKDRKDGFEFYPLNETDYDFLLKSLKKLLIDKQLNCHEKGTPIII